MRDLKKSIRTKEPRYSIRSDRFFIFNKLWDLKKSIRPNDVKDLVTVFDLIDFLESNKLWDLKKSIRPNGVKDLVTAFGLIDFLISNKLWD